MDSTKDSSKNDLERPLGEVTGRLSALETSYQTGILALTTSQTELGRVLSARMDSLSKEVNAMSLLIERNRGGLAAAGWIFGAICLLIGVVAAVVGIWVSLRK